MKNEQKKHKNEKSKLKTLEARMNNGRPRAILYHSSTLNELQVEILRKYADAEGYEVLFEVPTFNKGDYVEALVDMAEKGLFEVLVVAPLNLFGRTLQHHLYTKGRFDEFGVEVEFFAPSEAEESELIDAIREDVASPVVICDYAEGAVPA